VRRDDATGEKRGNDEAAQERSPYARQLRPHLHPPSLDRASASLRRRHSLRLSPADHGQGIGNWQVCER
jgi:hypothetical protein